MSAKKRRLDRLNVVSPCSTNWDRMSGDEKKRFCSECNKFVYDFSQMTPRQVEAIVSTNQGKMCARITRRPDGSLLTLEAPPVHTVATRRASPVVNATLAAILGLSGPANALNVDISAARLVVRSSADRDGDKVPYGGGEALVGGTVIAPQVAVIPNAVVKLISDAGAELKTKTSSEGEFTFAKVPYGVYIMLIEAQGFYTHVNTNVIVDTPQDARFEVRMKVKPGPVMGGAMSTPSSLLDLYRQSDLVAIAHVGRSTISEVDSEDGKRLKLKVLKTALHISSQLKGENKQQVILLYYLFVEDYPPPFKQGDRLLVLLEHRELGDGKWEGYEPAGWGESIKKVDDGALAIYRQRIEELTAIFRRGASDPAELVEWLVRCVEEPVTREEGASKLYESLNALASQREEENEARSKAGEIEESEDQMEGDDEDSTESNEDDEDEMSRENVKLAASLTQDHKNRLTGALFGISELGEADMGLANLIVELGDERLAPYLVSQLRRLVGEAPRFAESLVWTIARVLNDDDLKRLARDYDDAAEYDKSEDGDESIRQDSTRGRNSDGVSIAAIKRSAMLKDFLKLVEYKNKLEVER